MAITAAAVKELREQTGAGMMACKDALKETNGDLEAAVDYLRKKGLAAAQKKQSRVAAEGAVATVVDRDTGAQKVIEDAGYRYFTAVTLDDLELR